MNKKIFIVSFLLLLIILGGAYFFFNKYFVYENGKISKISDLKNYSEFVSAQNQGKMDDAIKIAQDILDKNPGEVSAMLSLAEAYVNKGSSDHKEAEYAPKALEIIDQVLVKDSNNSEAYRIQGYAYEIQEKFDESIKSYDKSLEIKPSDLTYNSRGHAYELMGQYQLAQDDYEKGYELNSENPNIQMNLARIYLSKGDEAKAKEFAENVINGNNGNTLFYIKASAYSVLGQIASNSGDKSLAIEKYSKAIEILATFVPGYIGRAQAMIFSSDTISDDYKIQIFNDLSKAVELDPNSSWSYYLFGKFYEKTNNYDLSLNNYKKALEILPKDLGFDVYSRDFAAKKYQDKIDSVSILLSNKLKK